MRGQNGDLSDAVGMTNFRLERQWDTLDAESQMSYAINFYDNGDVMSIVTDTVCSFPSESLPLGCASPSVEFRREATARMSPASPPLTAQTIQP